MAARRGLAYIGGMSERAFLFGIRGALCGLIKMIDGYLCCAHPKDGVRVDLSGVTITQLTKEPDMPTQTFAIELAGDAPFGYLVEGIAFVNMRGNPADPVVSSVTVTDAPVGPTTSSYLGGGKMWVQTDDATAVGATGTITVSALETGTEDDGVFTYTFVADTVAAADLGAVTVTKLTAAPV